MPGAPASASRASSSPSGSWNSTFTASPWPMKVGTRTQVAPTAISGPRIFRVSRAILASSPVEPSARKSPIWGTTLKAMVLPKARGSSRRFM